jgi:hypothetical protein
MPARRDFTPDELAARLEREREQNRLRQARWRARHRVTVTIKEGRHNGHAVTVTPSPSPTPLTPPRSRGSSGTPAVRGGSPRGNSRVSAVIDALREARVPHSLTDRDCKAIKQSTVEPARLAEAYAAARSGAWDNAWLRNNLSMEKVVNCFAGYEASLTAPKTSPRPMNGTGPYAPPAAFQRNLERTYKAPEDFSPDELARSDAARERVKGVLPARLRGRWRR